MTYVDSTYYLTNEIVAEAETLEMGGQLHVQLSGHGVAESKRETGERKDAAEGTEELAKQALDCAYDVAKDIS